MLDESYWDDNFVATAAIVHALYEMPNCGTGGMCHVVMEGNVRDSDLRYVLNDCCFNYNDWPKDTHKEHEIAYFICTMLIRMEYKQRVAFMKYMEHMNGCMAQSMDEFLKDGIIIESFVLEHIERWPNIPWW